MPRRAITKRKSSAKSNVLKFIASLLFLYAVISGLNSGIWGTYTITAQLWTPLLLAAAVLGSVALFFGSIAGMASKNINIGGKLVYITAFALVTLTVSTLPSVGFWVTLVGFVIGWLGTVIERK